MTQVAIVGLGLIGGSLGFDLVQRGYTVIGVARRPETAQQALALGAVHQAGTDLALVAAADLVMLCTPINVVVQTATAIVPHLKPQAIITDVASVKGEIVPAIAAVWPRFIGGHPMAGKAEAGLAVAEAGLFQRRPYVLTPTATTPEDVLITLITLVHDLGADLHQCSPEDHDQAVAWISHLPVMVSASLLLACQQESNPAIATLAQSLASSGFRDTSRVGGGVPELGTLMARHNRTAVLKGLAAYKQQLTALETVIQQGDWDILERYLSQAQQTRPQYVDPL
ncbi:prephenate/arogenate dehydrogenase [Nodosilinea sp. P-1105]|uniref:prephenate/arogenate dehydrogenase n=1 Tax=Nodosilinea sp. P-1105 TaxID=2546229 RepID=UPI001469B13E|nr:prephenate/arogenate dehydrogenase [Nodosilinea sp. P-1105]NMF85799.1 prephenate/arogenate dehydrogenase [Nodosilinea sp. P-1105]